MAKKKESLEDVQYREGVNMDNESVATRAKLMTGKPSSKLTNDQIRKANREYDYQDEREEKGSAVGPYAQLPKTKLTSK